MRSLVLLLFFFCGLFNFVQANPILADSCVTIVWKSGKSMSIRLVEKTDKFIRYTKCHEQKVIYKASLSECSNIDALVIPEKPKENVTKDADCQMIVLLSGTELKAKILEKNTKILRYYICDDAEKTEFTVPITEVQSFNGVENQVQSTLKVSDSCQTITWEGGKKLMVVVVSQDSTHFKYYKCSDKKKRIYTANNLDLESQSFRPEARKSAVLSTLALAFACAGILLWPMAIAGFIMGLIAWAKKKSGKKRAIWAVVIGGVITLLVILYFFFIFALGVV